MRWIKHLVSVQTEENVAAFVDEFGLEGYGFMWAVRESIALVMEPGNVTCAATYSLTRWTRIIGCSHKTFRKLANGLQVHEVMIVKIEGDQITISDRKLADLRDEYSKKSGHKTEKDRSVFPPDTESQPHAETDRNHTQTSQAVSAFDEFWRSFPRKQSQADAEKAWKELSPSSDLQGRIMIALEKNKKSPTWQIEGGRYIPSPAKWLRNRGWEDDLPSDPLVAQSMWLSRNSTRECIIIGGEENDNQC